MRNLENWIIASLLVAVAACSGDEPPTGGGGAPEPLEGLVVSTDAVDGVHLSWIVPDPAPESFTVKRDGVPIATLPGDAAAFEDRTATPGDVDAPRLSAESREASVSLEWEAPGTHRGASHGYEVIANAGAASRSATAIGSRRAPVVFGYSIDRDGAGLVSIESLAFDDTEAAPGSLNAPDLLVREAGDALILEWTEPQGLAGRTHTYRIVAESELGPSPPSAAVIERRSAPSVTTFEIERDGQPLDLAGPGDRSYEDPTASSGSILAPTLTAEARPEAVRLNWEAAETIAGSSHSYAVIAVSGMGAARSAAISAARGAPRLVGYSVRRDGEEIASLPGTAVEFADAGALPGTVAPPANVEATQGTRTDAVSVSWQAAGAGANPHHYELIVSSDGPATAMTDVVGGRSAPDVIGYEVRRDGGDWIPASGTSFIDPDAPGFHLVAVAVVDPEPLGEYVELGLEAPPTFGPPEPSSYEVRAVTAEGPGPSEAPVQGYRGEGAGGGAVTYQWQRSVGDADADYEDLDGLVDAGEIDHEPLLETGRYYRVEVRSGGAVGWSTPARASVPGFESVVAGWRHTCGIRSGDHRVFCWGANSYGQSTVPTTDAFDDVAVGDYHTCGIRGSDKRAVCWGMNQWGQTTAPSAETFASLSANSHYTCGIRAGDRTVVCWGDDSSNQLDAPAAVAFESITTVGGKACGVRIGDRSIVCWGRISGAPPTGAFDDVSLGGFSCGVRSADKKIACWGGGFTAPPDFGNETFESVAVGGSTACGLRAADRKVVCRGTDQWSRPTLLVSHGIYEEVSADGGVFCALRSPDRRLVCWGNNTTGAAPTLRSLDAFESVAVGSGLSCGVRLADHKMICWGNMYGWTMEPWWPPGEEYESVSAGPAHACGVLRDSHQLSCRGDDFHGQSTPPNSDAYTSVAAGAFHTCAIRASDGKVVCWGNNSDGGAPPLPSANAFEAISAGTFFTCGIRAVDQKIACWGDNGAGQAPPGPSTQSFAQVAAGGSHTCGIRAGDSKVLCWGKNDAGEAPTGPSSETFSRISAGRAFTCGIRASDGKRLCWGKNAKGQAPPGPSQDSFADVGAGEDHACGVRLPDRRIVCWGDSFIGAHVVELPIP